ncbi:hypothetical protein K503DRAFT_870101 [Rhizopogon vinicolor AM-OR11-026]|uniref:Velvet domain-containing protein n=1 Tax=Rhizopogon vinicolor AM-OR11-026 TaxID=1314800 RepID=A0A1B7MIW4_9AGAM|nr:hypothetical protein K503DRAFT_870101 [Rhizopogon vinicolor AM-OR11-026]
MPPREYELTVRQEPKQARMCGVGADRRPIDPPPIIHGRGSLEDRCKQRHRKFQKLQAWQLENVLQSFPFLLQISLLLFGLSLGVAMWTQQYIISIVIIIPSALGFILHFFTTTVSSMYPDCPFQMPISLVIQFICRRFRGQPGARGQRYHERESSAATVSAMQWILETTTDTNVVRLVFEAICSPVDIPSGSTLLHSMARNPACRTLRALPPPKFDDSAEYTAYWRTFISVIGAGKCPAVHLSALHVACRVRKVLAMVTAAKVDQPSLKKLLSELSKALLAAVKGDDSKPSPAVLAADNEDSDVYPSHLRS